MKDKFETFLSVVVERTTNKLIKWDATDDEGIFRLNLKEHYVILTFPRNLAKTNDFPIRFEIYQNNGDLEQEVIRKPDEDYYNRLHHLCRVIKGKSESLSDTVDNLMDELNSLNLY
ncbi:MAG: hypothetical protein A2X61_03025 [Ignavibacteria bacterium GWB2_35_12]|nr:MAG: hypothetical protein A2X63_11525 [Ignavibacteria bacterium GWA2_35_8]OGU38264.1 MAG: hypothetical protein A2X61_03025 [Ignavibacteria bacterium GWB2_35_12]OGU95485.1 MAG: hypothetical protein A2220_07200 [Ignavibacteria bacterium RIFOXYA2_FULL_35_10]OGV20798.1 MAG: hypothetical protein A2475_11520 [Ignavibacteria bacterium RIFOXYC2_FULL_35_21]